jgi:hypothetical protein
MVSCGWLVGRNDRPGCFLPLGWRARRSLERSCRDILAAQEVAESLLFEIEVSAGEQGAHVWPRIVGGRHDGAGHRWPFPNGGVREWSGAISERSEVVVGELDPFAWPHRAADHAAALVADVGIEHVNGGGAETNKLG